MIQNILALTVVFFAAAYTFYSVVKMLAVKKVSKCDGCSGCALKDTACTSSSCRINN